ncbi:MAG: TonB-dependent receptor plug domain-containing protein, partial [Chitinophagaceae bacterium]|nr:TonB-dependent receptor plug domain-containing protein [Chitinophagaceae bacterium]
MRKHFLLFVVLCVCMYAGAQTSDSTKTTELEEVVVSFNKWEQKLNEVPNKIVKINKLEILRTNPQTAADLLGQTGSVFIQKSQLGGGSPMIRGFATNRVLLVYDGVRMNNAIYRSGNLQNIISIDPLSVETAEVIFGPGSLIYGSDAIGGVMDFHTLDARFS